MRRRVIYIIVILFAFKLTAQVEKDKSLHFIGGTLYGLAGAGIAKQISNGDRYWTFAGAVGGSLLIGLAKEGIDKKQYDGWSNEDLLATVLGGMSVGFTIDIFTNKKHKKKHRNYSKTVLNLDRLEWENKLVTAMVRMPTLTTLSNPSNLFVE